MRGPGSRRKRLVAEAYDHIADGFLERLRAMPSERLLPYLERVTQGLERDARLLDLGCGAGVPFTRWLSARARVVGVDISMGQLALARRNVGEASFLLADMCSVQFRAGSFDAITALYSIIHVPREEQAALLAGLHELLRPGGRLLAVMGGNDWEGSEDDWLGLGATMYWSHYGAAAYEPMLERAGFRVVHSAFEVDNIDDTGGRHLFVLAEKP